MKSKADEFVNHMVKRCQIDGRLAWLMGPLSGAYDLMIEAYVEIHGLDRKQFEAAYRETLRPEKWR